MQFPDVTYEQPIYSDPSFPIIFHSDAMDERRRAVYTNWHAGIEVLLCYEGRGQLLHGAETADFGAGDLVVINSNVLHTLHLQAEPCRYFCMIVDLPYLLESGIHADSMQFAPVVRDEEPIAHYQAIVDAFDFKPPQYKPQVLAHVLLLFVSLVRGHLAPQPVPQPGSDRRSRQAIIQALEYIREHLCEPIQIEKISRHVGISKFYFCKLFHSYTGLSVLQYINMLKCDYARKYLLESNMNISEVAHMLGFQTLSYFSRLYKKHQHVLPSQERQQWAQEQEE